jgi:flagellar motility protein MotE (MotC chaperone)
LKNKKNDLGGKPMADIKQQIKEDTTQNSANNSPSIKKPKDNKVKWGVIIFALITSFGIIFGLLTYWFKNNLYNSAELARPYIKDIPVINLMLPVPPEEDPTILSREQLEEAYIKFYKENSELKTSLQTANNSINDLKKYKEDYDKYNNQNIADAKKNQEEKLQIDAQKKSIDTAISELSKLVKENDIEGFKDYYEKFDPATAQKVYAEVLKGGDENTKVADYVKLYESMDTSSAAKILEQMGMSNLDLVVKIMGKMKRQTAAEVIQNMNSDFASLLTEQMAAQYPSLFSK